MRISKQITKVSQLGSSLNKNFHLSSLLENADDMSAMSNSVGGQSENIYRYAMKYNLHKLLEREPRS